MDKQPPPPYYDNANSPHGFPNPGYGQQSPDYEPRTSLPAMVVYGPPAHLPTAPPPGPPVVMTPPPVVTTTSVVHVSTAAKPGCPVCHNNSWTGTYGCCAWLLCIFCFPVGIICCLCMRKKKCTKCGFVAM